MRTLSILLAATTVVQAQLAVTVSPPKTTGHKTVVAMAMKNNFSEKIESVRAAVFLIDDQGKMLGQSTKWVIGGSNTNGLAAGATNSFQFVITADRPFASTNLTARVNFTRIVLEGGKLADVTRDVQIQSSEK